MATAIGSEPVTGVVKVRCVRAIVDRFEDHADDLLHDFVSYAGNAEFAHFPIRLWDESLPDRFEAELLGSHLLDDRVNGFTRKSVERFPVASWCHVSGFRFQPLVGENVQVFLVQEPVEVVVHPVSIAVQFAQIFQSF